MSVMSPAGRLGWLSPVGSVTRGVPSQGVRAAEGDTGTGLCVTMGHPWVMEDGHSRLDSAKIFWGNFSGHRVEPSTNCSQAKLSLDGTGLGLPGGFSIITVAVRTGGTVILIYMIYGNAGCNDSSIYKQD